jgi:putative membrane protein
LPVAFTLSVSAIYEIIEWLIADILFVEQGISYLGMQGDIYWMRKKMCPLHL